MAAWGTGNNGNLRPPGSEFEARRRGSAGGKKSGEVRRVKKVLSEKIEVMLNRRVTNPKIKEQLCKDFARDAKTYGDAMIAAQIYQAVKGNTKAFNALWDKLPQDEETGESAPVNNDEYSVSDLISALESRTIKGVDNTGDDE